MNKPTAADRPRMLRSDVAVRLGVVGAALLIYGVYFGWSGWGEGWFARKPPVPSLARSAQLNRIAFVGVEGDVWVMSPDGTGLNALTKDGRGYRMPVWSPDGSQIAFLGPYSREDRTAVYVSPSDRAEPVAVFSEPQSNPFFLGWAPNGKSIVFLASESEESGVSFWQKPAAPRWRLVLRQISIKAPLKSLLKKEGQPLYFAWSPKSDALLLRSGTDLSIVSLNEAGTVHLLGNAPSQFNVPVWSRDGEKAYYFRQERTAPAGKAPTPALPAATGDSPRRHRSDRPPTQYDLAIASNLVEYNLHTSVEKTIHSIPQADTVRMVRSPNTDLIACQPLNFGGWSPGRRRLEACIADPGDGSVKPLGLSAWSIFWSPDGSKLALLTTSERGDRGYLASGGPRLVDWSVYRLDSGKARSLFPFEPSESCRDTMSHFDQWSVAMNLWSPDSRYILANARDGGGDAVWIVDSEGKEAPRRIAEGGYAVWSWR